MCPIPPHNPGGVLPPFDGIDPAQRAQRAPYRASLEEVVHRFATSPNRIAILRGYLRLRTVVHQAGLVNGFQWLDGSFIDQMAREPNDLDVVTFFFRPEGATRSTLGNLWSRYQDAFDPTAARRTYRCDAYYVDMSAPGTDELVRQTVYWHGLFSHQRETYTWRGMIEVNLSPSGDETALKQLDDIEAVRNAST